MGGFVTIFDCFCLVWLRKLSSLLHAQSAIHYKWLLSDWHIFKTRNKFAENEKKAECLIQNIIGHCFHSVLRFFLLLSFSFVSIGIYLNVCFCLYSLKQVYTSESGSDTHIHTAGKKQQFFFVQIRINTRRKYMLFILFQNVYLLLLVEPKTIVSYLRKKNIFTAS